MSDVSGSSGVLDTLTVLFTDLVGSTALRAELGEDVAEVVRRSHDAVVSEVVAGHGGRIVKGLGDGFLATFGSAARAVAAAVGIQQGVDALRFAEPYVPLSLRVGIGLGDVTVEDADVFGTPVIEAARLCEVAEGGQILAASVVETLARGRGGHVFTPVGDLDLKGLSEPVATVEIGWERSVRERGVPLPHALSARDGAFPFCGRAATLDALTARWKQTLHSGAKSCVLIAGEPGMGKTRLASEFAQRVHVDGTVVLFGRCDEELGIPYQPFVEALTHHAGHLDAEHVDSLGTRPAELTRLVPDLATRFGLVGERIDSGDAEVDQYRLFEAVDAWLAAAAGSGGLVLVVDDIHWAARPTLLLLRHVLRSQLQGRMLIVATYRDTDLDRTHPLADVLADLRRVPEVERIALDGISLTGVEDMMEAVNQAALDGPARELAAAVHAETEGNPFFVGELFRHLAESGALVHDGEVWRLAVDLSEMSLPDGIREVVGRRLSRLSESANAVLSWAAVIGRELRLDLLAAVAGDHEQVLDAIDAAVDARLVDETGVGRWRFSHALVRATLLAELRTTRRVRMHLAVGQAYEALLPSDVVALAQHFSEAATLGVGDKAVGYLVHAGDDALANLAFDDAADLFRRALDVIEDVDLDAPELAADAAIGLAIANRWRGIDSRADVARALDLATVIDDGARMARVLLETSRGFVSEVFVVDEVLVGQLEHCLEHLGDGASIERVRIMAALAQELAYSGDLPRQLALSEAAVTMARALGDAGALHEALSARGNVAQNVDHLGELPAINDELVRNSVHIGTAIVRAQVGASCIGWGAWVGHPQPFLEAFAAYAAAGDALPPQYRWISLAQRVGYELRFGTLANAEAMAGEMLERATATGELDAVTWYLNVMGFTYRQAGRLDEALDLFTPHMADESPVALVVAAVVTMLLCEADRPEEARPVAERCFPWGRDHRRDQSFLPNMGTLAISAVELGDLDNAAWLLDRLTPLTAYWSAWSGQAPIAPVSTLVGRLRAALGDFDGAEDAFGEALVHCRSTDARFFVAEALLYQGIARRDAGQTGDAIIVPISEALALSTAGGYGTLQRRAERSLSTM
ncbi:MAG TPA: AAA family ATPase [Acidimicrobiia bacterium]|nr:AAA family ATPase [Acidimicrobiia bacterium]